MKKGFTLVELLAAIILIGLIIGISVPAFNKYVSKSRKDSFKETLIGLSRALEIHVASDNEIDYSEPTEILSIDLEAENLNTIKSGSFYLEDGRIYFVNVSNGYFCGNGYKNDLSIHDGEC